MTMAVYVVDDDAALRESLVALIESAGWSAQAFADGERFLAAWRPEWRGCALLDVRMPGMSGLRIQQELVHRGSGLPVIFLTGHGDVPMAVRALKSGAVDFLQKPVAPSALLARLAGVLTLAAGSSDSSAREAEARARYGALTERERQVMGWVAAGRSNKDIARALGISHRTVEIHRGRVMRKMAAGTAAELVDLARICQGARGRA
jgi:two-component system response regulator FixJ